MSELTMEQLRETIRSEMRNAGLEGLGDEFLDGIQKHYAEWQKKSSSEQTRDRIAMMKIAAANGGGGTRHMPRKVEKKSVDEVTFAGLLWARAARAKLGAEATRSLAQRSGFAAEVRSLEAGDFGSGGSLIPPEYAAEIIEFLRPTAAVRAMGAVVVPMPSGGLTYGRMNSGVTTYWVGESEAITESQPTTGQLKFGAKKLAALVPVSNDLLRRAPAAAAAELQRDIVSAFATAEDVSFLRGQGTENQPSGLLNRVSSSNTFDANGTVNLDNVINDLAKAIYLVEDANHDIQSGGWIMHPRSAWGIMLQNTSDGYYPFMSEMATSGTVLTYRYRKTNNVSRTLGAGSDESRIFFGDWAQYRIGDTMSLQIDESDSASYGSSNDRSAFARDETVIRGLHEVDAAPRHDDAFSIIEAVTYGSGLDA